MSRNPDNGWFLYTGQEGMTRAEIAMQNATNFLNFVVLLHLPDGVTSDAILAANDIAEAASVAVYMHDQDVVNGGAQLESLAETLNEVAVEHGGTLDSDSIELETDSEGHEGWQLRNRYIFD